MKTTYQAQVFLCRKWHDTLKPSPNLRPLRKQITTEHPGQRHRIHRITTEIVKPEEVR